MRNEHAESEFLAKVAREADEEKALAYISRVRDRLRKGADEYGDLAYLQRTLPEILGEIAEEGEDGPGWAVLGRYLLDDGRLATEDRDHLERMLIAISVKFFEAWQLAELAIDFHEEALARNT